MFKTVAALSLASSALAHGIVSYINVEGQGFNGPEPNQASPGAAEWTAGINPIKDPYSPDMFCGPNAYANGKGYIGAGSSMNIYWEETQYSQWPHNTGPIITYLARCWSGDCSTMNADSANWFKIDQKGFENGQWKQASLMNSAGYTITIPWDLEEGDYLMRTEIISLHAQKPQYYPACVSFHIYGSGGSNTYSNDAWGSFPGTYSWSDPGLSISGGGIYNVHSDEQYQFPGPPLITVGQGGQASYRSNDDSQSTDSDKQDDGADEEDESSTCNDDSNTASSNPSCATQANEDECESKWTQCNKDYVPGTDFTCKDQWAQCRGQSVQRRLNSNAKMTTKRVKRDMHNQHAQHARRHH
ncbi:hypothetical protein E3P91_00155 [Wallemia ichthyophaga]|nr:hypothetical protein E3P91_00155 [Wallemia ichthyophaga]